MRVGQKVRIFRSKTFFLCNFSIFNAGWPTWSLLSNSITFFKKKESLLVNFLITMERRRSVCVQYNQLVPEIIAQDYTCVFFPTPTTSKLPYPSNFSQKTLRYVSSNQHYYQGCRKICSLITPFCRWPPFILLTFLEPSDFSSLNWHQKVFFDFLLPKRKKSFIF